MLETAAPSAPPPSPNGSNGRAANGRFSTGNRGGPGNPFAARVAKLRNALLEALTEEDLHGIVQGLVSKAKKFLQ